MNNWVPVFCEADEEEINKISLTIERQKKELEESRAKLVQIRQGSMTKANATKETTTVQMSNKKNPKSPEQKTKPKKNGQLKTLAKDDAEMPKLDELDQCKLKLKNNKPSH